MEGTKYTVTVTVEALSLDSVPNLALEAIAEFERRETVSGKIVKNDGDQVEWKTKTKKVAF